MPSAVSRIAPDTRESDVAVYLDNGLIADATFSRGVAIRRLWPEVHDRRMSVIRWDASVVTTPQIEGFVRTIYDLEGVGFAKLPGHLVSWHAGTSLNGVPQSLVCSSLIEYAALKVKIALAAMLKQHWSLQNSPPMLPASFLGHPLFSPVSVRWLEARP